MRPPATQTGRGAGGPPTGAAAREQASRVNGDSHERVTRDALNVLAIEIHDLAVDATGA